MSFFECERCGGAVGLFCFCETPTAPPLAKSYVNPPPVHPNAPLPPAQRKAWVMNFRRVSDELYRESLAVAASSGTASKRIERLKELQLEQLALLSQLSES